MGNGLCAVALCLLYLFWSSDPDLRPSLSEPVHVAQPLQCRGNMCEHEPTEPAPYAPAPNAAASDAAAPTATSSLPTALALAPMTSRTLRRPIRIACVGDSLTWGHTPSGGRHYSYPLELERLLQNPPDGANPCALFEVRNFGASSAALQRRFRCRLAPGDRRLSYWDTPAFAAARRYSADLVVVMLGTNDSKCATWPEALREAFRQDCTALLQTLRPNSTGASSEEGRAARPHPGPGLGPGRGTGWGLWLATPPRVYGRNRFFINDTTLHETVVPLLRSVAAARSVPVLDVTQPLEGNPRRLFLGDGVHPSPEGTRRMARAVFDTVYPHACAMA